MNLPNGHRPLLLVGKTQGEVKDSLSRCHVDNIVGVLVVDYCMTKILHVLGFCHFLLLRDCEAVSDELIDILR